MPAPHLRKNKPNRRASHHRIVQQQAIEICVRACAFHSPSLLGKCRERLSEAKITTYNDGFFSVVFCPDFLARGNTFAKTTTSCTICLSCTSYYLIRGAIRYEVEGDLGVGLLLKELLMTCYKREILREIPNQWMSRCWAARVWIGGLCGSQLLLICGVCK